MAVVVAQSVEQRHSVRAGQVRIPGQTCLFRFRIAVNLFSLGVRLYLRTFNRTVYTPSSSCFLSTIILRCTKKRGTLIPKEASSKTITKKFTTRTQFYKNILTLNKLYAGFNHSYWLLQVSVTIFSLSGC